MSFILAQDCWRWTLVDKDGRELAMSDHAFEKKTDAIADLEKLKAEHPDAAVVEEGS